MYFSNLEGFDSYSKDAVSVSSCLVDLAGTLKYVAKGLIKLLLNGAVLRSDVILCPLPCGKRVAR
uniref:Uncharacterized protein n=1 Tax=Anguilla anguilla TaxID=7936 RepID=A0A0E9PKT2_ANGAN